MSEQTESPALRVTRGNPTAEELAAVVAVLQGVAAAQQRRPHTPGVGTHRGGWKSYWRVVRAQLHPGDESWR